jgi:lysophospholipase L1-like esterase
LISTLFTRDALRLTIAFGLLHALAVPSFAADFELKDGDRVVWLGSTPIEREQRYGYWETALTARWPDRKITFRNLGWSGDNVFGEARLAFDINSPALGLKRMVDLTLAEKPTVIFIGYGTNESFDGEAGLDKFEKGYEKLLDALAPAKARIVLLAPPLFEQSKWSGLDLRRHKKDLKSFTDAIRNLAAKRQVPFVEEFAQRFGPAEPLTDDGMHFTEYGYWETALNLKSELHVRMTTLEPIELDGLGVKQVAQEVLTNPPAPPGHDARQADCIILGRNLKPGKYTLKIDGQATQTEDADTWMKPTISSGVHVYQGPSLDQAEKLRQAIIEKNRLYFYRWRPQNETYLFGFRKHEQGKNAKEVVEFDPLIAKAEEEIDKLKVPKTHRYELVPSERK